MEFFQEQLLKNIFVRESFRVDNEKYHCLKLQWLLMCDCINVFKIHRKYILNRFW